jgi:hypothetical protein
VLWQFRHVVEREPLRRHEPERVRRQIAATIGTGLVFDLDPLHRQAIVQGVLAILFFVVLIFWPAGTFDYWQGWLFLGIFAVSTAGFTVYLAIYDRPLLERRLKAGRNMSESGPRKSSYRWSCSRFLRISSCPRSITDTRGRRLRRGCRSLATG